MGCELAHGAHLATIGLDGVVLRVLLAVSVPRTREGEANPSGFRATVPLSCAANGGAALRLKNAGFAFRRPSMGGIAGGGALTTVVRFMVRFRLQSAADILFVVMQGYELGSSKICILQYSSVVLIDRM